MVCQYNAVPTEMQGLVGLSVVFRNSCILLRVASNYFKSQLAQTVSHDSLDIKIPTSKQLKWVIKISHTQHFTSLQRLWGRLPYGGSGVTRALIGGGGGGECIFIYSYIRVLPDGFLLKLSSFQKKSVGQNTNI